MPNIFRPTFEDGERPEGFRSRRARIGYELGEEGAHQILNRTEETVTFLAISSHGRPDVVVYPDSGKIGVGERLPKGGGLQAFFRRKCRDFDP
jgi:hypothetical protein